MTLWAMAWKVPPQIRSPARLLAAAVPPAAAPGAAAPANMSRAARRVKVSRRIRLAWIPCTSRSQAARATRVRVLPVPAPASISRGPSSCVTAWRCCSFRPSRMSPLSNMLLNIRPSRAASRTPRRPRHREPPRGPRQRSPPRGSGPRVRPPAMLETVRVSEFSRDDAPADQQPPVTIFGPDFPFPYDDWITHPVGLGSIPPERYGEEVAIIGAGVSGLIAAYELMRRV